MHYKDKKNENGFTIIEMLISVAIGMLLISTTISMFNAQRKTFSLQEELSWMTQNARTAMDMISRDVRMAGYMMGGTLTVSDTGTITFMIGTTTISYRHDANELEIEKKENTGNYQPMVEQIETLRFSYFDNNSSGTTETVSITIVARSEDPDPNYSGDGYRRATLTTSIKLRN